MPADRTPDPTDAALGLAALCLDGLGPVPAPWPEFDPLTAIAIEARARAVVHARDRRARAVALHGLACLIRAMDQPDFNPYDW